MFRNRNEALTLRVSWNNLQTCDCSSLPPYLWLVAGAKTRQVRKKQMTFRGVYVEGRELFVSVDFGGKEQVRKATAKPCNATKGSFVGILVVSMGVTRRA